MVTAAHAGLLLNVRKSAVAVLTNGQLSSTTPSDGSILATFPQLRLPTDIYQYLGFPCNVVQNDAAMKQKTRAEILRRVKLACSTPLAGVHRLNLINSFALSLINYSLGIAAWTQTELQGLDREVRCVLARHHIHYAEAPLARLYLPRKCNGRGLRSLVFMWETSLVRINGYIRDSLSWIYDAYPNSRVLQLLSETARHISLSYQTDNHSHFRNIFINRANEDLASQVVAQRTAALLARPEIAKESKAWYAKELMDAEYESVYFALYDHRVPFRDTLRAWSGYFMRATCRVCGAAAKFLANSQIWKATRQ